MAKSTEQAFGRLAFQIRRLPPSSEARKDLEIEHAWAEYRSDFSIYHTLRSQVTSARFEVAKTDLTALKDELANQGGLIEWNLSPWPARLTKWLTGYEASGFTTVAAFFDEAAAIAEAFDLAIDKARPQLRRFPKSDAPRQTGKTAREAKKRIQHLKNQAARAELNRGHKKGPSPSADTHSKGGKQGKKK